MHERAFIWKATTYLWDLNRRQSYFFFINNTEFRLYAIGEVHRRWDASSHERGRQRGRGSSKGGWTLVRGLPGPGAGAADGLVLRPSTDTEQIHAPSWPANQREVLVRPGQNTVTDLPGRCQLFFGDSCRQ